MTAAFCGVWFAHAVGPITEDRDRLWTKCGRDALTGLDGSTVGAPPARVLDPSMADPAVEAVNDPSPVSMRKEIEQYLLTVLLHPCPTEGKKLSHRRIVHAKAVKQARSAIASQTAFPVDVLPTYMAEIMRRAFQRPPAESITTVRAWLTGMRAMMRLREAKAVSA